jgi:hypothetical protein
VIVVIFMLRISLQSLHSIWLLGCAWTPSLELVFRQQLTCVFVVWRPGEVRDD